MEGEEENKTMKRRAEQLFEKLKINFKFKNEESFLL